MGTHLRVMRTIVQAGGSGNVFDLHEVVKSDFRRKRNELLSCLPRTPGKFLFVNLNAERHAGEHYKLQKFCTRGNWGNGKILRLHSRLSPLTNLGLSNYVVSKEGAQTI